MTNKIVLVKVVKEIEDGQLVYIKDGIAHKVTK